MNPGDIDPIRPQGDCVKITFFFTCTLAVHSNLTIGLEFNVNSTELYWSVWPTRRSLGNCMGVFCLRAAPLAHYTFIDYMLYDPL